MTSARLASWIVIVGILGCLGCAWNEEATLGRYDAVNLTGDQVEYLVVKNENGAKYTVAKAVYSNSNNKLYQVSASSISNFQQLKNWIKREKSQCSNFQKRL